MKAPPKKKVNQSCCPPKRPQPTLSLPPCAQRMMPDGFGGYIERDDDDEVKSIPARVMDGFSGDDEPVAAASPPPAAAPAAAAPAAPAPSSAPLTFDQMVANSVAQKEAVFGRALTDAEKADLANKLKALLSK